MTNNQRASFFPLAVGIMAGLVAGGGITYALTDNGMIGANKPATRSTPTALDSLKKQGYDVMAVDSANAPGWRLWTLQYNGIEMTAYAAGDQDSLIVGGDLYDATGTNISPQMLASHHRNHLTATGLSDRSRWVDIPVAGDTSNSASESASDKEALPESASPDDGASFQPSFDSLKTFDSGSPGKKAPGMIWLADPASPAVQKAFQSLTPATAKRIRFIPYPSSSSRLSRDPVAAILEADYRKPPGQSDFVTDYRGGDVDLPHTSTELLARTLHGEKGIAPQASDGHPADQFAYKGISDNVFLMEQLGVDTPQVFQQGKKGTSLTMRPLSEWMASHSQAEQANKNRE